MRRSKLVLNKQTVATLAEKEMARVQGGELVLITTVLKPSPDPWIVTTVLKPQPDPWIPVVVNTVIING